MSVQRALLPLLLLLALVAAFSVSAAYVVFGLLAAAWLLSRHDPPLAKRFSSPLTALVAVHAALVIVSAILSPDPVRSLKPLPGLVLFLLLPIAMDTLRRPDQAGRLLLALAAGGAILAVIGLAQYAGGSGALHDRIRGSLSHYMTFSALTMISGCLLAAFAFERKGRWRWASVAALLPFTAMVLTLTRSAYIGTLVAFLLYLALRRPRGLLVAVPAIVALLLLAPATVRQRFVSIADVHDETSRDRIAMARAGLRMIGDRPLFGMGPEMVKPYYTLYRDADAPRWRVPHLHNNVLQTAAASGLFAAAAYVALVALFFARAITGLFGRSAREPALLFAGPLLAVTAVTAAGLFEYNFGDTEVLIPTLLLMAVPFSRAASLATDE